MIQVDLDTIDISNLNRQFLFRRKHVGQPKSVVARESALLYTASDSECTIVAHHDDVKTLKYGPEFVKQFDIVLNALDNLSARRHVGRVCWSAGVPYVESGTAGWFGQVQPFIPGKTGCYECDMKPPPTTFPVCTIRSNPSKPIHTIMWAKHLFDLLFGKANDENAVTDLSSSNKSKEGEKESEISMAMQRTIDADLVVLEQKKLSGNFAQYIFHKVFSSDILAVGTLLNLWTERAPPKPYTLESVLQDVSFSTAPQPSGPEQSNQTLEDQKLWSIQKCAETFITTCAKLKKMAAEAGADGLSWDKDEPVHLDFVVSASNLRSSQYGIPIQSKFSIKSDAGNIIPAIATTNAIIAGLIVIEALKILTNRTDQSKSVYLVQSARKRSMLMNDSKPYKNPSCYVCSNQFVHIKVDTQALTLRTFLTEALEKQLGVLEASIIIGDDIVFESGGDFDHQLEKKLSDIKIENSSIVHVESFAFDFKLEISIEHTPSSAFENPNKPFQIVGSVAPPPSSSVQLAQRPSEKLDTTTINDKSANGRSSITEKANGAMDIITLDGDDDEEDEIIILDAPSPSPAETCDNDSSCKKRSHDEVQSAPDGKDEPESAQKRAAR